MDINELETYRLADAVKFNDQLNPRLWGPDEHLLPEVRDKLLAIADDFREFLGIDVEVKDITISGSNAAYTYTDHSDIDLHLVADLPRADSSDVYRELFNAKKYAYNDQHDFKIGGYDVELYVQDARQPHVSQGIYSVMNNDWIRVPRRRKPTVDDISVRSKYEDIGHRIDDAIASGDLTRMDDMAAKIREMRQAGLADTGEFGPENLAFKILRGNGTLDRLRDARRQAKDQLMSLDERRKGSKKKKKTRYGFGGYYFPGYHYYGQTDAVTDGGGDGGGGESVRESTESQQDIIERFTRSCADLLGIETVPVIKLRRDPQWTKINGTFGRYTADPDHRIELATHGRHIVDILRTLAHEMTHARQNEVVGLPSDAGETGSEYEDSANAMAGRIMRHWAESEPHMFKGVELEEVDSGQNPQPGDPIDWPEGTVHVKVSDVYDWYKLGQKLSNLKTARPEEFGTGVPETILVFNNEPQEEEMIDQLRRLGLDVHDVDPGEIPGQETPGHRDVDEGLRDKIAAAAAAACVAGSPGCATTGTDAIKTVQTIGRTAQNLPTRAGAQEELTTAVKDLLRRGTGTREGIETPVARDTKAHDDYYVFLQKKANLGRPMTRQEQEFIKTYRLAQQMRAQVAEASGYIPTRAQARDPRFSTALTVDIKPGQTGKEANKLGLKTDSQGRPQLLMKKLANLLEAVKLDEKCWDGYRQAGMKKKGDRQVPNCVPVEEDQDLFEVKMSPGELEKWANSEEAEGIQAGFEAELIFRDASRDDEGESELDWDADQRADSIESVVDFFMGGNDPIGRNYANRMRDRLYEELYDWQMEQIDREWEREAEDQVRDWMRNNISPDEYRDQAVEELGIDSDQPSEEQVAAIDQRAAELFDQAIDSAIENQDDNYERAREQFYDYRRDDTDYDEESFLSDRYRYMSDISNEFDLGWPYSTQGSSSYSGSRTTEDIAASLSTALGGARVVPGTDYRSVARRPGQWIVEGDGSIKPDDEENELGQEIVSPPMPLPETLQALSTVIDWANSDDGDAYTNSSTGLHMGISIPHKGGAVDYVKLVLFSGDDYVLDQFRDDTRDYAQSALDKLKDVQRRRRSTNEDQGLTGAEKTAAAMDLIKKNLIELAAQYVQNGVGENKTGFPSILIKPGYIEFRSPGGDYLSLANRDDTALKNTMLRFARAMYIAGRPDLERKEYAKKLYKLIDPQDDEALKLFLDYTTGKINREELKKSWARQVLAKEQPRKVEQEYEVYDKNTGETLETLRFARGEGEGMVSAAIADVIEKYSGQGMDISLRRPGEPEVEISRRAKIAKKISDRPTVYRVEAGDRSMLVQARDTEAAKQRAREQDDYYNRNRSYLTVTPATAEEIKQYQAQAQDNTQDRQDIEQRVTGSSGEQRYRVQWTERRDGRDITDSLGVTARNADAAMASVRSALEVQGRRPITISADTAPIAGSTLDLAQQRAQQAAGTGQPTADWADQLRRELSQQAGTWTGHWIVQDGQGRELTRFHGIGNNQADANRHAARWLGTNRPDLAGQEIEVVPEIR